MCLVGDVTRFFNPFFVFTFCSHPLVIWTAWMSIYHVQLAITCSCDYIFCAFGELLIFLWLNPNLDSQDSLQQIIIFLSCPWHFDWYTENSLAVNWKEGCWFFFIMFFRGRVYLLVALCFCLPNFYSFNLFFFFFFNICFILPFILRYHFSLSTL